MNLRRRLALAYYRVCGGFPAHLHGRRYRLVPEDRKFWRKVSRDEWERSTFTFLERCLSADSVCLDVGAWIGPTALFAAQRCRAVYCIEPDPFAYERLLANIRLNEVGNVLPFHGALSSRNAGVQIANERGFGNSMTRVRAAPAGGVTVLGMDLPSFIDWWGIDRIDLLKMDIEGAEFDLVPSIIDLLPRFKPAIHLSLHAPLLPPDERHDQLAAVTDLAARYAFCYDKHLQPVEPREIPGARFASCFNSVAMTDRALF